jgi:hypothetical protein
MRIRARAPKGRQVRVGVSVFHGIAPRVSDERLSPRSGLTGAAIVMPGAFALVVLHKLYLVSSLGAEHLPA